MIFLVAFCLFLETSSASQGLPNAHSLLSRTRRQTADEIHCDRESLKAECTTGYLQNYVNAISKCGTNVSTINAIELSCRKNERGLYCAEALAYVDGNCTGSTCTDGCSNSLVLAGCCANSGAAGLISYLTTCNIQIPFPCERTNLRIPNIVQGRSCTFTDVLSASCDNIRPVLNAIASEKACKENTERLRDLCSSRNGQYCFEEFISSSSVAFQAITKADNDCPSVSSCSLQCNASLNFVKNTVGCCSPYANTSYYFIQSSLHSTQLWNTCGIPVPQRCGSFSVVYNSSFVRSLLCLIIAGFAMVFSKRR